MREDTLNEERRLNRELRNRIGEVFGELAWEAQQVFSEKPEQGKESYWAVAPIRAYEGDYWPGYSVKV